MQSVPITTKAVSSNPAHGEVCSIQHYVIKSVSDLRQVGVFFWVLSSTKKLTATIWNIVESGVKHHNLIPIEIKIVLKLSLRLNDWLLFNGKWGVFQPYSWEEQFTINTPFRDTDGTRRSLWTHVLPQRKWKRVGHFASQPVTNVHSLLICTAKYVYVQEA